jgi:4-hydroxy-tetrahydrodipicolinate synthase
MTRRPQVVVALLTPFDADGGIDERALAAHVERLVDAGVDALMPCGTTGEGPLLAEEEVVRAVAATVAAADGRVPVLAHVGRTDTSSTLLLLARARELGVDGISAVVPYYFAYSDDELLAHYRALLGAAGDTAVYAYTIPERTGNELAPDVVRTLGREGLRGVKDSTKSFERHLEYLECGVDVLIGTDAFVRDAFDAGAAGCVSALANVRPDLLVALRDGADPEAAQAEVLSLRELLPLRALNAAVAESVPGYPSAYRPPLT